MTALAAAVTRGYGLDEGVRALGLTLSASQLAQLDAYVALLAKWNRAYNLTAIREPARMITHHLLDSLAVLPHFPQRQGLRILDVGCGAGVPGLPLAIARPDWRVVLLDSSAKKVAFVTQAVLELALANATAAAARIEHFRPAAPFDVVITRAFSDLRTFAQSSAALVAPGGRLYAMKGALPHAEIAALPPDVEVVSTQALSVPGLDAERHLVVMQLREAGA
jgi:16S rRNA (guanine527-N7)-methyltransferase